MAEPVRLDVAMNDVYAKLQDAYLAATAGYAEMTREELIDRLAALRWETSRDV